MKRFAFPKGTNPEVIKSFFMQRQQQMPVNPMTPVPMEVYSQHITHVIEKSDANISGALRAMAENIRTPDNSHKIDELKNSIDDLQQTIETKADEIVKALTAKKMLIMKDGKPVGVKIGG